MKTTIDSRSRHHHGPVDIFGVKVRSPAVDALIEELLTGDPSAPRTVLYANPHVLNVACRDRVLHDALRDADLVYVDGVGVRIAARLLGKRLSARTTAADWIDDLCAQAALRGRRLYLIAGESGVAAQAAERLQVRHPALRVVGTHNGFLDAGASRDVVRAVNRSGADLVLVGMGTPTQERWIARHRNEMKVPVVWSIGALLDFVAGAQLRAPGWMARNHLEWLWRLALEPRRLGRRYIFGNPVFLSRVLRQRLTAGPSATDGHDS